MLIWIIFLIEFLMLLQIIRIVLRLRRWSRAAELIRPGDPVYFEADGRVRPVRPGDSHIVGIALEDGTIATHGAIRFMVSSPPGEDDWFMKKWKEKRS
jgi:hypothetical protein